MTTTPTRRRAAASRSTAAHRAPGTSKRGGRRAPKADELRIRMYNVGFGDCFLLTIPTSEGPRRILIDCGTHPASKGPHRAEGDIAPLLLADLEAEMPRPRVDVVVASHRHRDHLSGFEHEAFAKLEVGEVWLPWTENRDDPVATALRNRMGVAADALGVARIGIVNPSPARAAADELIANILGLKNEGSMDRLWDGFLGSPLRRYLSASDEPLETPLLPGVKIHLLGPATDEATLRNLEPPKKETFAHLGAATPSPDDETRQPFDPEWAIPAGMARTLDTFDGLHVSGQVVGAIRALAADELLAAASSITSSINGTSLVFVIDVRGLGLFFPGDAQWGTWKSILDSPTARSLVQRCVFYKIGHHGSHNASPRTFVEQVIASGSVAAVSVAPVTIWPAIPQSELISAIGKRAAVVQSNPLLTAPPVPAPGPAPVPAPVPPLPPNVEVRGDESIDFVFPVPSP